MITNLQKSSEFEVVYPKLFDNNFIDKSLNRYLNNKAQFIYSKIKQEDCTDLEEIIDYIEHAVNEVDEIEGEWLTTIGIDVYNDEVIEDEILNRLCILYILENMTKTGDRYVKAITDEETEKYPYLNQAFSSHMDIMNYEMIYENHEKITLFPLFLSIRFIADEENPRMVFEINSAYIKRTL